MLTTRVAKLSATALRRQFSFPKSNSARRSLSFYTNTRPIGQNGNSRAWFGVSEVPVKKLCCFVWLVSV